jgi:hypothetical protein
LAVVVAQERLLSLCSAMTCIPRLPIVQYRSLATTALFFVIVGLRHVKRCRKWKVESQGCTKRNDDERLSRRMSRKDCEMASDLTINEREKKGVGRVGVEPTTPAMSRRYPNQARPPARHIVKKIVAQIYVVDSP